MVHTCLFFFFSFIAHHLDLPVLTPSFPTRRSSVLSAPRDCGGEPRSCRPAPSPPRAGAAGPPPRAAARSLRVRAVRACRPAHPRVRRDRSEEHTSELQSLMRQSYAVFCLKKKIKHTSNTRKHSKTYIENTYV